MSSSAKLNALLMNCMVLACSSFAPLNTARTPGASGVARSQSSMSATSCSASAPGATFALTYMIRCPSCRKIVLTLGRASLVTKLLIGLCPSRVATRSSSNLEKPRADSGYLSRISISSSASSGRNRPISTPLVISCTLEPTLATSAPIIAAFSRSTVISHSMAGTGAVSSTSLSVALDSK